MMQKIPVDQLVNMHDALKNLSARIELAYASPHNTLFNEQIYKSDARLILHKTLAEIVIEAARLLEGSDYRLIVYDGLRTTTAQAKMLETQAVRQNPQWLEEPRLLSPPGKGGHPRGMAVDVSLETKDGKLLDMGTPFDFLSSDPSPEKNPAHRCYRNFYEHVFQNRNILDSLMLAAAEKCKTSLVLLPQEWWDFRLPHDIYDTYAPLSDDDLPPEMRCCG